MKHGEGSKARGQSNSGTANITRQSQVKDKAPTASRMLISFCNPSTWSASKTSFSNDFHPEPSNMKWGGRGVLMWHYSFIICGDIIFWEFLKTLWTVHLEKLTGFICCSGQSERQWEGGLSFPSTKLFLEGLFHSLTSSLPSCSLCPKSSWRYQQPGDFL